MHLDSLTIKNFRVLEDIHVKKLGHVNLIVGKNNSGKSTVLEALALLASGFDKKVVSRITQNREIGRHQHNYKSFENDISFKSLFNSSSFYSEVYLGNNNDYIRFRMSDILELPAEDSNEFIYDVDDLKVISSRELKHLKILQNNFMYQSKSKKIHTNFFNCEYIDTNTLNIESLSAEWEQFLLTEAEDIALQMLKIIEPNIIDLAFLNENDQRVPYVRLANSKQRTPLHQMGDGIFRLLQIILKVLKAKDGFLLIDEFENGLHYSVQPDVWRLVFKLAEEFNIQVFATTHSWDCIESFAEVARKSELDGVLFRLGRSVRKSEYGKVIATEFDEDELYNMTKMQMEVR